VAFSAVFFDLASLLTCFLIFISLFIPLTIIISILSGEAYSLYGMAQDAVLADQLKNLLEDHHILEKINHLLKNVGISVNYEDLIQPVSMLGKYVGLFMFEQVSFILSNTLKFITGSLFMLLVIYYLLIDGDKLASFVIDLSPLPKEQDEKLIQKFKDIAGAVLIGNGLCGVIQGIIGGIVFGIFGLPSAFLWGVIMCFLAFLPVVGIGAVFVPASVILLLKGRIFAGLFFIIFYLILSGGMEYIFKPKLVGNRVKMHTLVVFLSIMGGLNLFGLLGIIYGPLIATSFLTLADIYNSNYRSFVDPETIVNVNASV